MKMGLALLALLVVSNMQFQVRGEPQVPCYFIFGDSLADNGNNNLLSTTAKANHQPYGIDFPKGPTGRFCNGRTTVDIIAELLGFDNLIPPFATANGLDILKGVNYASGSSGIRKETGQHLGVRISMDGQLKNHRVTVSRIVNILGSNQSATEYLNKCLYSVGMGSNDFINNYFMPQHYGTSRRYTPNQYARILIRKYSQQMMTLYNYGARKIALFGVGLIGCTPNSVFLHRPNGSACVDIMNSAALLLNEELISLVDHLNINIHDATFIYVNEMGLAEDKSSVGFKVSNVGCCQVGENGLCIPSQTPCQHRSEYVFWDSFHPTEAANQITARRAYTAMFPSDTRPIDVSHLAEL